jgi:manganese-dependent inorganic pyrophosphatase
MRLASLLYGIGCNRTKEREKVKYMSKRNEKIYVVGHKNPDTDSICSAIAYANLKRELTGGDYVARRAGQINEETNYVLKKFGVTPPPLLENVKLQVKDMDIQHIEGVDPNVSIRETWQLMRKCGHKTIPILKDEELLGVISTGDIATSYMEVSDNGMLSTARTQYRNIRKTLDGVVLTGNEHGYFTKGNVQIAASEIQTMKEIVEEDDLVLVGNMYKAQMEVLDLDISCMVICCSGADVQIAPDVVAKAEDKNVVVLKTPYDTFTSARLINQSIPVKQYMTRMPLETFNLTDYVDDIKEVMAKKKYRDFPILDEEGRFQGFVSRRRFLSMQKKQVILVDHNEKSQAVDGIEEADIVEILDHHRLGSLETVGPVYFRNQPVGCTATIIYQMYEEAGIKITPIIAGLLCCAIISDTLLFRSPTCTRVDESIANRLARVAGIDLEETAQEMFRAGSDLKGKSAEEICFQDFKQFKANDISFGVGQISSISKEELREIKAVLTPHLPIVLKENNLQMIYFMLTDILDESTELICCGDGAKQHIIDAFELNPGTNRVLLNGVVSRKKQLIPTLMAALQEQ